ncbi:MAG TPA: hypothetical protein VG797_00085 [Phycisphaerales bacterium]|nr:hypothetical protein [Phycisphaerales bacterium]
MRTLWSIICLLAIAHLLAILGFVGWLAAGNRLDGSRIERVRALFAETIAAEKQRVQGEQAIVDKATAAAEAEKKASTPPVTAEGNLKAHESEEEINRLRVERVQRETSDLIKTLLREREDLEHRKAEFEAERAEFNRTREERAKQDGSEQFEKAVRMYQSVKPLEAKNMMKTLIAQGQTDQVVSYLNAISPRIASKIVSAFNTDDPAVAADLLERLRTRGVNLPPSGT